LVIGASATLFKVVNPAFWTEAASYTTITVQQFSEGFSKGIYGLAWFIAVMGAIDILSTWFKTLKPKQKDLK